MDSGMWVERGAGEKGLFALIPVYYLSFVQWADRRLYFIIKKRKMSKCTSQQEMQMADKSMKRCSSLLIIITYY